MDPFGGPIVEVLFFPDGDDVLERIDQEPGGQKRFDSVRAADGDSDADVSEFEVSESVNDPAGGDGPALASRCDDFLHLRRRHFRVGFVVECGGASSVGHVADGAQEHHNGSGGVFADRFGQPGSVDRIVGQLDHCLLGRESSGVP